MTEREQQLKQVALSEAIRYMSSDASPRTFKAESVVEVAKLFEAFLKDES